MKYDELIDIHCDETDDVISRFVELLNALAIAESVRAPPRTTASQCLLFWFRR